MNEECSHKFSVDRVFPGIPIAQILTCKRCHHKFFGLYGRVGVPDMIHEISDKVSEKQFGDLLVSGIIYK